MITRPTERDAGEEASGSAAGAREAPGAADVAAGAAGRTPAAAGAALATESTHHLPQGVFDAAVANWINDRLRSSPVASRAPAWNFLMAELPGLRDYIEREFEP